VKTILFDFDGTIADTLDVIVRIGNQLAPQFGYPPVTAAELKQLRHLPTREILRQTNIAVWKLPLLLRRLRLELQREAATLQLIPEIKQTLITLALLDYRLGIVTTNSQETVELFLKHHGLFELFSFVYAEVKIWGKANTLRRLLKQEQLSRETVIYIGDEVRDIEAAQKIQIKVIAVGWGFNTPDILATYHPDFLVDHPTQIAEIMSQW
jgi:phosphoglycolate phosphatase